MRAYYIIKELRQEKYIEVYPGMKTKIFDRDAVYESTEFCTNIDNALHFLTCNEAEKILETVLGLDKKAFVIFQIIKVYRDYT